MASIVNKLIYNGSIKDYPKFLRDNIHYEVKMGSQAYAVNNNNSDIDVYGFCIPPKRFIFPYESGYIYGFGKKPPMFEQYQKHHIMFNDQNFDVSIYNIVKYFTLCINNNPNMIDSLFVPVNCIIHMSKIGEYVRSNRHLFLSKKVYHTFKGYAFSQLSKMNDKHLIEYVELCNKYSINPKCNKRDFYGLFPFDEKEKERLMFLVDKVFTSGHVSKRVDSIIKYGYDVKFAYHLCRLLDECEQILETGDLDLTRSKEFLKSIRKGEVKKEYIIEFFDKKIAYLDKLYHDSIVVPYSVDEEEIKEILINCLEMHYGSIGSFEKYTRNNLASFVIEIERVLEKIKKVS